MFVKYWTLCVNLIIWHVKGKDGVIWPENVIYSDIFGDGDAIQIENGDCDCCNHWKHHTFSSSVFFTSQKDKSWRSNKHQRNKKLSELSLFLVANSKREHTSDDINLMTLYVFANYINISQNYVVGMTLKLESESRDHAFSMQFEYFQKHLCDNTSF